MSDSCHLTRSVLAGVVLFLALVATAKSQEPSAPTYPRPGTEAAVTTVDAFHHALNRTDTVAVAGVFTPEAEAYELPVGGKGFARVDWLAHPWQRYLIQTFQAPVVPAAGSVQVTVIERTVSGNFVFQRERVRSYLAGRPLAEFAWSVLYRIRGQRISEVWFLGPEPDPLDVPIVEAPTFERGTGPTVWIDVAHGNTATPGGTLWPLSELLRRDGYRVRAWQARFAAPALDSVEILMIANPAPAGRAPGTPDDVSAVAFTEQEVDALTNWVAQGGNLLLAADHAPYAGYSAPLAAEFGATFHDGFARDTSRDRGGNFLFHREDGALRPHPITDGSSASERVEAVGTLLGQAFEASSEIEPLLVLPESVILEAEAYGEAEDGMPAGGWLQGGVRDFGDGRVGLFGEVWLFRYLDGDNPQLEGAENGQFILNLLRWLSRGSRP